jgi:hypothetical protein
MQQQKRYDRHFSLFRCKTVFSSWLAAGWQLNLTTPGGSRQGYIYIYTGTYFGYVFSYLYNQQNIF